MGRRWRTLAGLTGALTVLGLAPMAATAAPTPTGAGCSWPARLDPTAANTLYPDSAANYWITDLPADADDQGPVSVRSLHVADDVPALPVQRRRAARQRHRPRPRQPESLCPGGQPVCDAAQLPPPRRLRPEARLACA